MPVKVDEVVRGLPPPPELPQERLNEHMGVSRLSAPWRIAPVAAQAADGITTYMNLKSGGQEFNPNLKGLSKSPEALLAFKLAQGIGTQALANFIHKKYGDRKGGELLAKLVSAGSTAQGLYGAGYSFSHRKK